MEDTDIVYDLPSQLRVTQMWIKEKIELLESIVYELDRRLSELEKLR